MRLVHLADLHLGYRAYNKLTSKGLNIRERDVIRAFKECLDRIAAINPDLILIAGDIFHRPRPGNTSIYLTIKFLLEFRKACTSPIIMVSGNHEASKSLENESILKVIEATVPGVKVIDKQIEQFALDELGVNVLGIPYNALCDFERTNITPDNNYKYNVLAIHGSYESIKCPELDTYGQTCLINAENISQGKWNYVALGHYHKYTKLGENTYYSGAIERTSSNIWQEARDPKGFIEYNLETGQQRFHMLECTRKVVDIKRINASRLTAEEINCLIEEEMSKIPDLEETIVRLTLEDIDSLTMRNLDYKKLGTYRKQALHFRLNLIKKGYEQDSVSEKGIIKERKSLLEQFEDELNTFELAPGLNQEKFRDLAKSYIYE
ncbi:MAG: hypothetical protein A2Y25_07045 [Candidatus Melainabacteria bacterium GWF2_37_15]|nr:MAG: hypothetical protein A2Y25_07045 [Candidatus Melainabacteria bacterium GWF2_37_15]